MGDIVKIKFEKLQNICVFHNDWHICIYIRNRDKGKELSCNRIACPIIK